MSLPHVVITIPRAQGPCFTWSRVSTAVFPTLTRRINLANAHLIWVFRETMELIHTNSNFGQPEDTHRCLALKIGVFPVVSPIPHPHRRSQSPFWPHSGAWFACTSLLAPRQSYHCPRVAQSHNPPRVLGIETP